MPQHQRARGWLLLTMTTPATREANSLSVFMIFIDFSVSNFIRFFVIFILCVMNLNISSLHTKDMTIKLSKMAKNTPKIAKTAYIK